MSRLTRGRPWSVVLLALLVGAFALALAFTSGIGGVSPRSAQAADVALTQFTGDCANSMADSRLQADWIENGQGAIVADPIAGTDHEHNFFGAAHRPDGPLPNRAITDSLRSSQMANMDTLCDRETNHSLYWAPRLYWGSTTNYPTDGYRTGVYYQRGSIPDTVDVSPFPLGFMMIAKAPGTGDTPADDALVWWHCDKALNVLQSKDRNHQPVSANNGKCNDTNYGTIGVTIQFPNCWDGNDGIAKNDPSDRRFEGGARVRHSIDIDGNPGGPSRCPQGWVTLPTLNMLIDYDIPPGANGQVKVQIDGAISDFTAMHADYFNSEDQGTLTQVCINNRHNLVPAPYDPDSEASLKDFCRH